MNKKNTIIRQGFLICLIALISINLFHLGKRTINLQEKRKMVPFSFAGYKFSGLERIFKGIEYVGYYTDKDVGLPVNNMQYSQAQFVLAPTILEINNTDHKYTIFDCSNMDIALKKIAELHLTPLIKNSYGIILAEKTQ